jgi:hypothetical protein
MRCSYAIALAGTVIFSSCLENNSTFAPRTMKWPLLWAALPSFLLAVQADFGDYVDPTFNCPATTTCSQVCVDDVNSCPLEMLCVVGEQLCADGSCASACTGNEVSPCEFKCAPIACVKVIDTLDSCATKYGALYDFETQCGALENESETHRWDFTAPAFSFVYSWIILSTVFVLTWCTYNQRIAPVEGSTTSLDLDFSNAGDKITSIGYQTGYRATPVGNFIYFMTMSTLLGFQASLAFLSVDYYVQETRVAGGKGMIVEDEYQVLLFFEAVWCKCDIVSMSDLPHVF